MTRTQAQQYAFTIGQEHLKRRAGHGVEDCKLRAALGRVLPQDIGKRVYEVRCDGGGPSIYQVENDEQRARRLAQEAAK